MYSITKDFLRTSRNWKCNFSNKIMTDKSCSFIKNEYPLLLRVAIRLKLKGIFLTSPKFQSFKNRLHRFIKKISKFHILVFVHARTFIFKHRIKLIGCISVSAGWHVPAHSEPLMYNGSIFLLRINTERKHKPDILNELIFMWLLREQNFTIEKLISFGTSWFWSKITKS